MPNIVVIGAGLGGLPAAYELRHRLSRDHTVTLISNHPSFTFIPGLIHVALNLTPLDHIQLDLKFLAQRHGLNWVCGDVTALDTSHQRITIAHERQIDYDYVVIATGASFAFEQIPGSGPHTGYTQSVCTAEHALQAKTEWLKFLDHPGPLVVGAGEGAGCFGPAYEFALMADWELRQHGLRHQVPITYVTPEPYVGHLGVSGVKNAQRLTAQLLKEREIEVIDNMRIRAVEPEQILLANGQRLPFKYAMILPSFSGVKFIRDTPGLGDDKGFIPVLPTQQHRTISNVYAVGVSVKLSQPDQTDIPIGLPKSGQMTEAMATAAAHNIAVELGEIKAPLHSPTLDALCFAEFGETGIAYIAAPVIPDSETGKRRTSYAMRGPWVVCAKKAFEEYFMLKMRYGIGMPWFEKLGLRLLFNLKLFQAEPSISRAVERT